MQYSFSALESVDSGCQQSSNHKQNKQEQHPHEGDPFGCCQWIVPSNMGFSFQIYRLDTTQEAVKSVFFPLVNISAAFFLLVQG